MAETYFIPGDSEAYDVLRQVLKGFDRFQHIKYDDIILIYKIAEKNRFSAETRKIPKLYSPLIPNKQIIITLFRPCWESLNQPKKVALMYHELVHIIRDEEGDEYKLVRHDVEDFKELIEKLGFNYEKAVDLFKEMKVSPMDEGKSPTKEDDAL